MTHPPNRKPLPSLSPNYFWLALVGGLQMVMGLGMLFLAFLMGIVLLNGFQRQDTTLLVGVASLPLTLGLILGGLTCIGLGSLLLAIRDIARNSWEHGAT